MPVTLIALLSVLRLTQPAPAPTIDDGVRALMRGDYRAAVAAFRPFSDGPNADPAAQFLMGIVQMSSQGADFNQGRACGLFTSVSTSTHVFAPAAMSLADALRGQMGAGASMFCAGRILPEYVPGSFTLGPSHSVEIGSSSITVRYNGAEKRIMTGLLPGMIAMPVRYVSLDVTRPAPVRRHFLLTFMWSPDRLDAPSTWTLAWSLAEVIGADYVGVTGERYAVAVAGATPPEGFDVDKVVRVFVNADGDVEWNAGTPDNLRRGIVPVRASR